MTQGAGQIISVTFPDCQLAERCVKVITIKVSFGALAPALCHWLTSTHKLTVIVAA